VCSFQKLLEYTPLKTHFYKKHGNGSGQNMYVNTAVPGAKLAADVSIKALMAQENNRLVDILAKANSEGMGLANYNGMKGDRYAIEKWLQSGW